MNPDNQFRPGRIFFVLWAFTVLVQIISLQVRLALFGGTGWLTYIKFTAFSERIGFIAVLAVFCAAVCGLWTMLFGGIRRLMKCGAEMVQRWCATLWIVVVIVDLIFRHQVGELLGNAFDFFEFATGVGGVWRMIIQAFQWYGDVILCAVAGVTAFAAVTWFFFKWFFKSERKISFLDGIPWWALNTGTIAATVFGILFMSVMASSFPNSHKVLANETAFGGGLNAVVNVGSDFDGDGYGAFDLPSDKEPFDDHVHPHALDDPGDGIDQDQILGDLQVEAVPEALKKRVQSQGIPNRMSYLDRRNVVIVLMESVRYDMIDAMVDGRPVMPELRSFIDRGARRIDGAFATRGFTQNSVTQTFWGSYFDPGHSLVDDFKELGYHTAVFNGEELGDEEFDESCGWNRAGDTIVDPSVIEANVDHHHSVPANMLMDDVEKFLDGYDRSNPLFLYLFYQDPHFPYQQDNPPVLVDREISRTEIAVKTRPRLWRTYANQVHHLDMAAGRLIHSLERNQMLDNSLVIFVSDHGESLFDDGYLLGHGIEIGDTMTHAVMVVSGAQHEVPKLISHPDIRRFIHEDFAKTSLDNGEMPAVSELPVLQFIGATTVPSAISHRYADGSRVTWEFASQVAWRESDHAENALSRQLYRLPDHGNDDVDKKVDVGRDLFPIERFKTPIANPLQNRDVQNLILEWEYLQWYHRHE